MIKSYSAQDQSMHHVVVDQLSKRYRSKPALRDVSFHVHRGEVHGIVGSNGAGKTTLLRILVGLVRPTGGTVQVIGRPELVECGRISRGLGYLVEGPALPPYLTGRQLLSSLIATSGRSVPLGTVNALVNQVGLSQASATRIRGYSKGMRQRLGLAVALLFDPDLLILDEPTDGLDPEGIQRLRQIVRALRNRGGSVILTSHAISEVHALADRITVLHGGYVAGSLRPGASSAELEREVAHLIEVAPSREGR